MNIVNNDFGYYPDPTSGRPLANGYVFIGEPSRDPEIQSNQKEVTLTFSDGSSTKVGQPLRIGPGGVIYHNNTYAQVNVDGLFSIKVLDSFQNPVYYIASTTGTQITDSDEVVPGTGTVGLPQLDAAVQALLNEIGINGSNIAQEILDRAAADTQEALNRTQAIVSAIDPLQNQLNTVDSVANTALGTATSASTLSVGNDARLTGIDNTLVSISATQQSNTSEILSNTASLGSQNTRIIAVEDSISDVYGDGSNVILSSFASDYSTIKSAFENPTTGLAATRTLSVDAQNRLDNVGGVSSAKTIEQLNAEVVQLSSDVASGVAGAASVASVQDANTRIDGLQDRLNDTGGGLSVESVASNLLTTTASANQAANDAGTALITANAGVSTADAATARINNLGAGETVEALALRVTSVDSALTTETNTLRGRIETTESSLVLLNGIQALWEVKNTANDVTASIGLYNDNGDTRLLIKAADLVISSPGADDLQFEAEGGRIYPSTGFSLYRTLESLAPGTVQLSGRDFIRAFRKNVSGAVTVNLSADNDTVNTVFTIENAIGTIGAINSGNITVNAAVLNGLIIGGFRNVPSLTITPGSKYRFTHIGGNIYEAAREEVNFYDAVDGTPSTIVPADQTRVRIASTETVVAQGLHHIRAVIRHNRSNSSSPAGLRFQWGFDGATADAHLGATNYLPIGQTGPQGASESSLITFDGSGQVDQAEFTSGASSPSVTIIEGTLFSSGGVFFLSASKTNSVADDTFISGYSFVDIKLIKAA